MTKKKDSYGYDAVPLSAQRMLVVRYDLFPHVLVHKGHRLADGSYRWVSSWNAGHQNLGVHQPDSSSLLAVMPVEEGEKLAETLESLGIWHQTAMDELHRVFVRRRDELLAQHHVSAHKLAPKKVGDKDAKAGT